MIIGYYGTRFYRNVVFSFSDNDVTVSHHITRLWANFVRTGNPGEEWNPVEENKKMFLNLSLEPHMEIRDDYYNQRMEFWRSIL